MPTLAPNHARAEGAAGRRQALALKLRRLREMEIGEITGRTRQEASKWWDRVAPPGRRATPVGKPVQWEARLEGFHTAAPGRFFPGAADARTPAVLAQRAPEAVRDTIAGAEQILRGRFDLLGYHGLRFAAPIDWHLDPVSGRRSPRTHWSRLDALDVRSVGDSKVVWELNRHQWLVGLGQAYRLTGDERYAQAVATQIGAWLGANPAGIGINWASSLEVALRLTAWCWALVLVGRSPALTAELFARITASIQDHGRHVERYLSHYYSPNTHLTGEALGLFHAGTVFPEMERAPRWRETGTRILAAELRRQVLTDGVYFEQSTCYQRYTVEIGLHLLILSARNGWRVPPGVGDRVQAMLDFLLAVRSPRGEVPQIGDSDGGCLAPLARRSRGDLRGVFATAAVLFSRPDYAWAAGGAAPEVAWLLGPPGLVAFDALTPTPPAFPPSRLFAQGGYAVMRDGWDDDGHQLLFDVGPLAAPGSGGHGHADLLSVQCWAFGEPFLVDPGTGTYAHETWRAFFRGTAAHSTVTVDGESQAVTAGPFSWRQRPRVRLRRWLSAPSFDFADAEHDAYGRLPDPVRHRRRALFVKPRFWMLVDDLEGAEAHHVDLRFQFGAMEVAFDPAGWARARAGGRALLVRCFASAPLHARIRRGSKHPPEGWESPDYGRRRPAPVLVYTAAARLPVRMVTLLWPAEHPDAPPPAVSPLVGEVGELRGLVLHGGRETVVIEGPNGLPVYSQAPGRGV